MNWRWWSLLNIGVVSMALGQYYFSFVDEVISRDQTYITLGMIVVALVCSISTLGKTWTGWHEFVTDLMPRVGLIGTVIGFMISLDSTAIADNLETISDVKSMLLVVLTGMSTALTTTLAGLVLQVWLDLQKKAIYDHST